MQNKYAGDLGDFGKLGLLRWLTGIHPHTGSDDRGLLSLGIIWYLVSPHVDRDGNQKDGRHIRYLCNQIPNKFHECDEKLFEALKPIGLAKCERRQRSGVAELEGAGLWDLERTKFFSELCDEDGQSLLAEVRRKWFHRAREAVAPCDVVFVDPDNGLLEDHRVKERVSPKHALLSEIEDLWKADHSLVIYHTPNRFGRHNEQIRELSGRLCKILPKCTLSWGGRYRRGSSRAFFVLVQRRHHDVLSHRLGQFVSSPWVMRKHWDRELLVPP